MSFPFKTIPFAHQRAVFGEEHEHYGLLWEQGCGKTKPVIDVAARHYLRANISGLLVVAPRGVDRNWVSDELPAHMSADVDYYAYRYKSSDAGTKRFNVACKELLDLGKPRLVVLTMSYEAFRTEAGKKLAKEFLTKRKVMMVLDESQRIKNVVAKRSMTIIAAGKYAAYRWILSGTPMDKPTDIYNQIRFLDPDFWKRRDIAGMTAFRARFEITQPRGAPGRQFLKVVGYRDLSIIRDWIQPISKRLLKTDCLDLPPKIYSKRYFEMTPTQRSAYNSLRDVFLAQIEGGATEVTAINPMVRLLRLHQIASGYLPDPNDMSSDPRLIEIDPVNENARIACLVEELEDLEDRKVIIWYRFRRDGDNILKVLGDKAVRYDGETSERDRVAGIARFRDPNGAQYFCANPQTIGLGITLNEASDVINYSHSFVLEHRLQSEDRNHRIGTVRAVRYLDMAAEDTVDSRIIACLRSKRDLAGVVLGDDPKAWI